MFILLLFFRNMDSMIWWSFNDQHVSIVSPNDIKQSFGGKSNWGYSFSQANAYMLMYRQVRNTLYYKYRIYCGVLTR